MVSRHIYFQLVFRIVLIALTASGMAFLYYGGNFIIATLLLLLLIVQTVLLITYVNQTNRKIAYFFDAIKNEDFTLRFPEKLSVKSLEELNHSLNMLNEMIQDIHLKKLAQEQYYQEIIKNADIGIFTYNEKGHIFFANSKVEELFNYKPLNHIKQLSQIDDKLYDLFSGFEAFERKLIQLTNEREKKQLALKSKAINFNEKDLILVVAQDIHQELDEKETDSWVRLIRVLTHEIMNTITPITSISESVLGYFKNNKGLVTIEDFKESHIKNTVKGLEVIKNQGKDLMDFVQSYRSFLSLPPPDKTIVPAGRLLEKVKVLMNPKKEHSHIALEVVVDPEDLEFFIDEKQISQILINLCKNAIQSLKEQNNGMVRIMASVTKEGKKFIEVRDNGPGIPEDLLDEIFVPFFTTKTTGTGIGLSLSKQIMHLHGGSIQATSNVNTVFTLTFT